MPKLRLKDVVFRYGVQRVQGVLYRQNGIDVLYCQEQGWILPIPWSISERDVGSRCSAYVYPSTRKICERLGPDDLPLHRFSDSDLDLISDQKTLEYVIDEARIRYLPWIIRFFLGIAAGIGVFVFGVLLKAKLVYISGFIVSILGIACLRTVMSILSATKIYDANGNWYDLVTGRSSLNGGTRVPGR